MAELVSLDAIAPSVVSLDAVIEADTEEDVSHQLRWVRGDTGPDTEFVVKDRNGTVVNITGATPRARIRRKGKTTVLLTKTLTVTDGPNGKCKMTLASTDWDAGKIDAKGDYELELEITFSSGMVVSDFDIYPVVVRDAVG